MLKHWHYRCRASLAMFAEDLRRQWRGKPASSLPTPRALELDELERRTLYNATPLAALAAPAGPFSLPA